MSKFFFLMREKEAEIVQKWLEGDIARRFIYYQVFQPKVIKMATFRLAATLEINNSDLCHLSSVNIIEIRGLDGLWVTYLLITDVYKMIV